MVVWLDRLARSVSRLLALIKQLEAAGAHFRDPIDTTTPQGKAWHVPRQMLGAVAQLLNVEMQQLA